MGRGTRSRGRPEAGAQPTLLKKRCHPPPLAWDVGGENCVEPLDGEAREAQRVVG
jgi:hypothetical protein